MGAYQTVAVGTDGSDSSLRAVDRAATIAGSAGATLVIVCAYKSKHDGADADQHVVGSSPAEETLDRARSRAEVVADVTVDTIAVAGDPVDAVLGVVGDRKAELVVVGNRGLNGLAGRLLGSVPQGISRGAAGDVLIVHTT